MLCYLLKWLKIEVTWKSCLFAKCVRSTEKPYVIYFVISWYKISQLRTFGWFVNSNPKNMWPICWKHLDGSFSFIASRLKMHKLPPAKNCSSSNQSHLRFNEFSWCGALVKRQKELLNTEKKRKKALIICIIFLTEKNPIQ